MESIHPNRAGLVLALLLGCLHFAWSLLVAIGWAQALVDFIFWLHFIKLDYAIAEFNAGTALLLIAVTASIGYVVGWAFAALWNKLHQQTSEENMSDRLKNMMWLHLCFLGIFIVFAFFISKYLFIFETPLYMNSPSQLVFLACIVTSTVALTVIGNRFRDVMDRIDKEKLEIELKKSYCYKLDERYEKLNNSRDACKIGLFHMTYILAVQVIMTCLTSLRILFKFEFLDIWLIWGSFYLFGCLWVFYFFRYGGGEHLLPLLKIWKK